MINFRLVLLLVFSSLVMSCNFGPYHADDIEVFKESEVWPLAKAIDNHNTKKVKSLLESNPEWVDYKEKKYGMTLLYWVMYNSPRMMDEYFYEEAKLLIQYGASPYTLTKDKDSPIMEAANIHKGSSRFIKLCIESEHTGKLSKKELNYHLNEALLEACGKLWGEVIGVGLLVDAGADINYFNRDSTRTPVSESLIHNNINISKYLIIDKNAQFDYNIKFEVDRSNWRVLKILQNKTYSDEPEKEKVWKEIMLYVEEQEKEKHE